jgi:hypothetical protein
MQPEDPKVRPRSRELLTILLALLPLAGAWLCSYLLFEYAKVGRHRAAYDLLRSDEDLFEQTYDRRDALPGAAAEIRWIGSATEPAHMAIIGSSPTARGIAREASRELAEGRSLDISKVWSFVTPIDRSLDTLKTVHEIQPVDVAVLECGFAFANDYMLGHRMESGLFKSDWNPTFPLHDSRLRALRSALGLPPIELGTAEQYGLRRRYLQRQLTARRWLELPPVDGYEEREEGTSSNPKLLGNYLLSHVLRRVATFARENAIGLIVFVPPGLHPVLWYGDGDYGNGGVDPSSESRRALRAIAYLERFKVLDYHDYTEDQGLFSDPLHLNPRGALEFSSTFFADLERVVASKGEDVAYEIRVRGEEPNDAGDARTGTAPTKGRVLSSARSSSGLRPDLE